MPMVAAGLIIDDPTLQPVRRLVSLVGIVFFWFRFGLSAVAAARAGQSSSAT